MKQSFYNPIVLLLCILVLSQTVLNQPDLVTTTPVFVSENPI